MAPKVQTIMLLLKLIFPGTQQVTNILTEPRMRIELAVVCLIKGKRTSSGMSLLATESIVKINQQVCQNLLIMRLFTSAIENLQTIFSAFRPDYAPTHLNLV